MAVLPISVVCRQSCSKKLKRWYYVWHKGGAQNTNGKMRYASQVRGPGNYTSLAKTVLVIANNMCMEI